MPAFSLVGIDTDPASVPGDDPGVLAAARRGDSAALESLLHDHYDRLHALCRRMLGNDADALDATQDAMVSAVRSIARFDGRSSFGTWLYRIATNACLDELRRRRRRPMVGLPADIDDGSRLVAPRLGDGSDGDGNPADRVAAHLEVDAALRMLAVDHRVALVLREVCDLSYDEIAAVLDVPVGTVRSRIARGRAALADLLAAPDRDGAGNVPGVRGVQSPSRTTYRTP